MISSKIGLGYSNYSVLGIKFLIHGCEEPMKIGTVERYNLSLRGTLNIGGKSQPNGGLRRTSRLLESHKEGMGLLSHQNVAALLKPFWALDPQPDSRA